MTEGEPGLENGGETPDAVTRRKDDGQIAPLKVITDIFEEALIDGDATPEKLQAVRDQRSKFAHGPHDEGVKGTRRDVNQHLGG